MRLLVLVAVGLILAAPPASGPTHPQAAPPIIVLLDRYDAGEFDAVVDAFAGIDDVEDARKTLEKHGAAWTEALGPAAVPRRRLVVATFALEFANARMTDEWQALWPALKWSCDLLAEGEPTEGERLWHLATIAWGEGGRHWETLIDPSYTFFDRSNRTQPIIQLERRDGDVHEHIVHAQRRFLDDRRLQFEDEHVDALRFGATWKRRPRPANERFAERLEDIVARLAPLSEDPEVGPEAELWAGLMLLLELGRPGEAMAHLEAASRSPDPFVASLAYYAAGRTIDDNGDRVVAERHYRRALEVMPRVQSVSLSLSSLLVASGRAAEAYALMRESFDGPQVVDPFKTYGLGDYRHFDGYLAQLRAELRR